MATETPTTVRRALCEVCLQSFPEERIARSDGRVVCEDCAFRTQRGAAISPTGAHMSAETEPAAVSSSGLLAGMFAGVRAWSSGRWWWARLPLLIAFAYILVRHLGNAQYQSIFKPLNLGVHELGHFVFAPLGDLLGMAGGTLLQCLVPVASMAMFCRQRDYFAITAGLGWLATNLFDVAVYVGDARAMALPLVTPGGGYVIHDWNFLLGRMGILRWDTSLALGLRCAAVACLGAAILAGSWIVWLMLRSRKAPVPDKYPHLSGSVYG